MNVRKDLTTNDYRVWDNNILPSCWIFYKLLFYPPIVKKSIINL